LNIGAERSVVVSRGQRFDSAPRVNNLAMSSIKKFYSRLQSIFYFYPLKIIKTSIKWNLQSLWKLLLLDCLLKVHLISWLVKLFI